MPTTKLKSSKLADQIARLQAEMRKAEQVEDEAADAMLVRLARKAHLRDSFITQARSAIARHAKQRAATPNETEE